MQMSNSEKLMIMLALIHNTNVMKNHNLKRIQQAYQFAKKYPNLKLQMKKSIQKRQKKLKLVYWLTKLTHRIDNSTELLNTDLLLVWTQLRSATRYLFIIHKNNQPLLNEIWQIIQQRKHYQLNSDLMRLAKSINASNLNIIVQRFLLWGKMREEKLGIFKQYTIKMLHLLPLTALQQYYQSQIAHQHNVKKYTKGLRVLQKLKNKHMKYFYRGAIRITPLYAQQLQQAILQCAKDCAVAKDTLQQ